MATAFNYVKFVRGTPNAFNNLAEKNSDTLYFISNSDEDKGSLYLGSKLISKDVSSVTDLDDILISETLADKHILSYDEQSSKWVNKAIVDAIGLMIGATATTQGANGLVPAPGIGQQDMFLRGDGTWGKPQEVVDFDADNKTLDILENSNTITLKDFGVKYYRYVVETNDYALQEVDATHPWKAELEPKVVSENGELILGWFEPNPVIKEIPTLKLQVETIAGSVTNLERLLNEKANISTVYTKEETNTRIAEEIAKVNHLTRKTFNSISEAEVFILLEDHPENYVYMILSSDVLEDNKYDEYLYIDGHLEKVGSWQTDLSGYVTKLEFDSHVSNIEALLNNKADKIEVETITSRVNDLEMMLNNKANKTDLDSLSNLVGTLDTKVSDLETFMNSDYFITKEDYNADMNAVKDAVTWKEL